MKILNIKSNRGKYILNGKTAHNSKEFIKLGFSATVFLLCIFEKILKRLQIIIMKYQTYLLLYIRSKMLSSSRDALLKLSKTTSPQKPFPCDCISLYTRIIHSPPCPLISITPPPCKAKIICIVLSSINYK